jgi:DNA-binding CsgD family transcriptional regulator
LKLTPREAEVLYRISEGKSNQDIGIILSASAATICKQVEHILCKLNVENRTAAAVMAIENCRSIAERSKKKWSRSHTTIIASVAEPLSQILSDGCEFCDAITDLIA